jgi:DNA-binding transcriptional MocR family regulator
MPNSPPNFDDLFQTVPREATLANHVTQQPESLIVENRLQPGDRLPSERELAQQFGISQSITLLRRLGQSPLEYRCDDPGAAHRIGATGHA